MRTSQQGRRLSPSPRWASLAPFNPLRTGREALRPDDRALANQTSERRCRSFGAHPARLIIPARLYAGAREQSNHRRLVLGQRPAKDRDRPRREKPAAPPQRIKQLLGRLCRRRAPPWSRASGCTAARMADGGPSCEASHSPRPAVPFRSQRTAAGAPRLRHLTLPIQGGMLPRQPAAPLPFVHRSIGAP